MVAEGREVGCAGETGRLVLTHLMVRLHPRCPLTVSYNLDLSLRPHTEIHARTRTGSDKGI